MNLSSKNENNTVYLEEVAVSHTNNFLVTKRPEMTKIATLKVIVHGGLKVLATTPDKTS